MASDLSCPKCESENTQKISIIIASGTTNRESTSNVSGVAYGSGVSGYISGKQTTYSSSQTELAEKFSNELHKDSPWSGLIGTLMAGVSIAAGIYAWKYFHSSTWGWSVGVGVFFGICLLMAIYKPSEASAAKNELLRRWQDEGCYCHRCSHSFIPGSNEVYSYSDQN
ncbi:MAG: hypothetical protein ACD_23C00326G0002 [uncultured bacterium]|nr:MAG: hypothetical protein ACD_23C00326G0002 [uncultured bacterium]